MWRVTIATWGTEVVIEASLQESHKGLRMLLNAASFPVVNKISQYKKTINAWKLFSSTFLISIYIKNTKNNKTLGISFLQANTLK